MTSDLLIGVLGLALLLAAAAAVALLRARKRSSQQVGEVVQQVTASFQEAIRELAESSPTRVTGELAATLDLEEVIERTIDGAAAVPGVDAVLLESTGPGGAPLRRSLGMSDAEAARVTVALPEHENLRSLDLAFRYRIDESVEVPPIRSGIAVPMRADGTIVGTLAVFSRAAGAPLGDSQLEDIERLAYRAGPALENARRFAEARALADLDALTGLHNRRYFHETLAREVGRAHRYDRRLALILFDLDDFKTINDRIGHLPGDSVLEEVARRMKSVVRSADVACRVGGDEFGVVLPESVGVDAELLASRIAHAISAEPIGKAGTIFISAGIAELREGDDAVELFERTDAALYRAKDLGKARTVVASRENGEPKLR